MSNRTDEADVIYRFPAGELRPEHCDAFVHALRSVLTQPALPVAVVLTADGHPTTGRTALGVSEWDQSSRWTLLQYRSFDTLAEYSWPLFLNAEPQLLFSHDDAFAEVVAQVSAYAAEWEALIARARSEHWRFSQRSAAIQALLLHSELVARHVPVVELVEDGGCRVLRGTGN